MFELACQGANIASVPLCPRLSLKAARVASTWILWRLPRVTPWTAEFQRIAAFEPVAVRFLAFCICLTMHLCSPRPTPCFSHGFSNHFRKTAPTFLAVLMD